MRATLFEFRHRWWIFLFLFSAAFMVYSVDRVNSAQAMAGWMARHLGATVSENIYRIIVGCGALLLALAAFLRTWGTSYLQAEVMRDSRVHTEKLLADGPYRYVRNPLYLGNIIMAVAIGLMASRLGFVILALGMVIFVLRLLLREEAELARDLGEPYQQFSAAVPRLLPSLWPRVPAAGNPAQWRQGFRAELMYWLLSLAMATFAITLNIKLYWAVLIPAMAFAWFYKRPETKKDQASG